MMQKIILDTDIGDDIDDALAISFALACKELELVGVTTVLRDVDKRAKIARNLLDVAGRKDIPVYKGIGTPLVHKVDMFHVPPQWWPEMEACEYNKDMDAIDFMAEAICQNPGQITLVPIGPLTNIAVLLLKHRELKSKIKGINLMGGAFYNFYINKYSDYNIEKDPEAAKYVFDSGVPVKAIGIDVTMHCMLRQKYFDGFENSEDPHIMFLMKLINAWRAAVPWKYPCLHDPLAVFSVFDDELIQYEEKYVDVECHGEFTLCMTVPHNRNRYKGLEGYHEKTTALVAKSVRTKEFVDLFAKRVFNV